MLANKNSASASEALLACLNENMNIPIYGETSFGKGIMQDFYEYPDKGYLKYTNAEWLTPKGNAINKKGVKATKEIAKSKIFNALNLVYDFEKPIKNDSVAPELVNFQKALQALGYQTGRVDGYYSPKTQKAVDDFKKANNLKGEKDLSIKVKAKIVERLFIEKENRENDNVLVEALK